MRMLVSMCHLSSDIHDEDVSFFLDIAIPTMSYSHPDIAILTMFYSHPDTPIQNVLVLGRHWRPSQTRNGLTE